MSEREAHRQTTRVAGWIGTITQGGGSFVKLISPYPGLICVTLSAFSQSARVNSPNFHDSPSFLTRSNMKALSGPESPTLPEGE
jgi:hypothetical protein